MEIQTIQSALAGIHRINEFFELEEKEPLEEKEQKMQEKLPFVELKNVTFGYDEHVVAGSLKLPGAGWRSGHSGGAGPEPERAQS